MPMDERMFRLVWLGPVGRGFVRVSARGVAKRATGTSVPGVTAPTAARVVSNGSGKAKRAITPVPADRVAALEARIAALEQWRDSTGAQ
jgi:hypothetical protein